MGIGTRSAGCCTDIFNVSIWASGANFKVQEPTFPMETLEFVIYPDGRVKELVTGIVGSSCAEVTAAIEAQLGEVTAQQKTSEFFAQSTQQAATTSQPAYASW